jgi:isopenicillin N synthase-like dioxygenase
MNVNRYIDQFVLVTLHDGSKHQGIFKLSGVEFSTRRVYYEVHDGKEVFHIPAEEIESIRLVAMN